MPSRKQRRRRQKQLRHEYEYVLLDEEGNEQPVEPSELKKKETNGKARATRSTRSVREVKPPSWRRSAKRAAIFAPFIVIFLSIGKHPPPVAARLAIALLYAAVFVPMFFFVDRMAYRAYRRRLGRG